MTEPVPSPIPEPDTPAPGLPEPAPEEEPEALSNADRLHGLFSSALQDVLAGILDRLDKAGI